jgi:AcrR family transcriptional regulator
LLGSFKCNGFLPTYAAFNLIGDPDMHGREFLMALTGLNSRGYKNSTLLFTLARIFIARSAVGKLINPPWKGIAEPMWEPVQIRHRSAYYDAFFTEALLSFGETGLPSPDQARASRRAIDAMVEFCLSTSREEVKSHDGSIVSVITALAPSPHPRFSRFFAQIKQDLGFGIYVPDCDTTACSFSAATQAGSTDPILDQPLLDFYTGYQVNDGANEPLVSVPINDNINYDGAIATWIDNLAGERPYGNDLDPTLNLDVLEVSFRNCTRWKVIETPKRLETVRRILGFQHRLVASGAFTNPRSHIYYLPELFSAYFGRCYAAFRALPEAARQAIDPDDAFGFIRLRVLAYVEKELITREMNPFDAALALIALGHLGADISHFAPALHCIVRATGEGGRKGPFKAYEWNKMKTPTRILVGGPEVTSAFVLMGLALARQKMMQHSTV